MILILLIVIPLLAGILIWVTPAKSAKYIALLSSLVTAIVATSAIAKYNGGVTLSVDYSWISTIHSRFHLELTSWNVIFIAIAAFSYVLVYSWFIYKDFAKASTFYALMSLTQVGIMGVFLSFDALLFYLFWELALIPVYFLCSGWGSGDNKLRITFKFFVYTFVGSVLMLVAMMYLYYSHGNTMEWVDWVAGAKNLSGLEQKVLFVLLLIGLGVKIPIFPLHTWQTSTYSIAPRPTLMILSAVMSKMGLFGMIQWMIYILPDAYESMRSLIVILTVVGIIYASYIAMVDDGIVRIMAFSSVAHMSMMVLAMFLDMDEGVMAASFQALSHSIVILGLWMLIESIERSYGTLSLDEIGGGLASTSTTLAVFLVFFAFANIGLPLTMGFVGEFLMLDVIFGYNPYLMILAGTSVIFSAVYMLRMLRKILYGSTSSHTIYLNNTQKSILSILVATVLYLGVYPYHILESLRGIYEDIVSYIN